MQVQQQTLGCESSTTEAPLPSLFSRLQAIFNRQAPQLGVQPQTPQQISKYKEMKATGYIIRRNENQAVVTTMHFPMFARTGTIVDASLVPASCRVNCDFNDLIKSRMSFKWKLLDARAAISPTAAPDPMPLRLRLLYASTNSILDYINNTPTNPFRTLSPLVPKYTGVNDVEIARFPPIDINAIPDASINWINGDGNASQGVYSGFTPREFDFIPDRAFNPFFAWMAILPLTLGGVFPDYLFNFVMETESL